jgi:hypothetical protein
MRPLCSVCNRVPRAVAYHRANGTVQYRSKCARCSRLNKKLPAQKPRWQLAGYQLKRECDVCGFKPKILRQLMVYHRNGNLHDVSLTNLRTVCHNCAVELQYNESAWVRSDQQL